LQNIKKPDGHVFQGRNHVRKVRGDFSATQVFCIVGNSFNPQNTVAFIVHFEGQFAEVHFEHRQIIRRFLDRKFGLGTPLFLAMTRTVFPSEDGLDCSDVQGITGQVETI